MDADVLPAHTPPEVVFSILRHLHARDARALACVSRAWREVFRADGYQDHWRAAAAADLGLRAKPPPHANEPWGVVYWRMKEERCHGCIAQRSVAAEYGAFAVVCMAEVTLFPLCGRCFERERQQGPVGMLLGVTEDRMVDLQLPKRTLGKRIRGRHYAGFWWDLKGDECAIDIYVLNPTRLSS